MITVTASNINLTHKVENIEQLNPIINQWISILNKLPQKKQFSILKISFDEVAFFTAITPGKIFDIKAEIKEFVASFSGKKCPDFLIPSDYIMISKQPNLITRDVRALETVINSDGA